MPKYISLSEIQRALREGETTCRALVEHYLSQIEKTRHLNAYVEVWAEEALKKADELDAGFEKNPGSAGRLFGAVLSLKDNICYAGHQVTAASKILEGFTSLYSATAVERLLAEDAIFIGRTNCDQFGMGSSNENSVYGPVLNAADPERVSGGSSGGAAVSVQTNTCLAALGSDTGGSVRQPAAFCGIWGFKPTYSRISRHGLIAYGSSFDQIGVLANNPADIATLLDVMQGPDEFDSTAVHAPPAFAPSGAMAGKPSTVYRPPSTVYRLPSTVYRLPSTVYRLPSTVYRLPSTVHRPPSTVYRLPSTVYRPPSTVYRLPSTVYRPPSTVYRLPSTVKIAYFPETIENEGLDAGVRSVTLQFIEQLRCAGQVVEPVAFDLLDYIIPTYYILTTAEASSNLARYDGIRYGRRSPQAKTLEETYLLSRSEGFSEEVKRRILLGTFVLSSGYYDAYYNKAQRARALIRNKVLDVLSEYDFILMPVTPATAWRFGEKSDDPVAMYLSDIYTVLANLAGIPALAIPAGHHPENDLPVGVQFMAAPWEDVKLLEFAGKMV